ncbi:hypothetical protein AAFF_G00049290 [Aldrovandia affinis]|uniref:Uncharacterized protein n=1 Tax=Aldrovandia affinis TaxID=143900 RepID=A0AAD7WFK4_9TELE|nr:hypothetical protein AAFF_G00049290 [Aldrovandia affinis]
MASPRPRRDGGTIDLHPMELSHPASWQIVSHALSAWRAGEVSLPPGRPCCQSSACPRSDDVVKEPAGRVRAGERSRSVTANAHTPANAVTIVF